MSVVLLEEVRYYGNSYSAYHILRNRSLPLFAAIKGESKKKRLLSQAIKIRITVQGLKYAFYIAWIQRPLFSRRSYSSFARMFKCFPPESKFHSSVVTFRHASKISLGNGFHVQVIGFTIVYMLFVEKSNKRIVEVFIWKEHNWSITLTKNSTRIRGWFSKKQYLYAPVHIPDKVCGVSLSARYFQFLWFYKRVLTRIPPSPILVQ